MPASERLIVKPWLDSYPQGMPAKIDLASLPTLSQMLQDCLREHAQHDAFESFGKRLTYAEIESASSAVASWLQQQKCQKGERIALMMPNVMAYPVALFGVLLSGYTVVNVNPLYTARELSHQINDSGATTLFVLENFCHVVQEALPFMPSLKRIIIVSAGDLLGLKGMLINLVARKVKKVVPAYVLPGTTSFADVILTGRAKAMAPVTITHDDVAFLQYTGGTTGVSKGATLTQFNVAANVAQIDAWLGPPLRDGTRHVMVAALPLYHIFGLTGCCIFMARLGAMCLLIANPRDFDGFIAALKKSRVTIFSGVNTLYNALIHHPKIKDVDFSQMRFAVAGGMALQSSVSKNWKKLTGVAILEGYGLSETSPVVTLNPTNLSEYSGSIGYPIPSTDVVIRDESGNDLPVGEPGELCIRGPQVMRGYWQRPEETDKVMTDDGFFRSGDIAVMLPDGEIKIVDRLKDMVLVSGFNVYPNEVEDVIARHPGVLEVAIVGAPDEQSGEVPVAYIVRKDPTLTEATIRNYCRDELTGYKIPRHVIFKDSLPKTNVGKVLRRTLRDEASRTKF